ncbi:hypothetical protein C1H69_13155 [Billgrantia endophytica]|uniref:Uncharacterized protein n=1 Tax=Billgrantia endophytica TaxID=2033802 RepID=A0A2N7U2X6_9GAMM|nr:hypothetical protein C1H69_13155 [Halomonas endophytica]
MMLAAHVQRLGGQSDIVYADHHSSPFNQCMHCAASVTGQCMVMVPRAEGSSMRISPEEMGGVGKSAVAGTGSGRSRAWPATGSWP